MWINVKLFVWDEKEILNSKKKIYLEFEGQIFMCKFHLYQHYFQNPLIGLINFVKFLFLLA